MDSLLADRLSIFSTLALLIMRVELVINKTKIRIPIHIIITNFDFMVEPFDKGTSSHVETYTK